MQANHEMRLDCIELLLWILLSVLVHATTGKDPNNGTQISACPTMSNRPSSLHFNAYTPATSKESVVTGCACIPDTKDGDKYTENHVVHVSADRAATVYLTVNGIYHRTTKSLPHHKVYKYEFALSSNKDVTWLVTVEDTPSNNVSSYKFYVSMGSTIVFQEKTLPNVAFEPSKLPHQANSRFNWFESTGLFPDGRITSFSQFDISKVAKVTITPLQQAGPNGESEQLYTKKCSISSIEENFHSPYIEYLLYNESVPALGCEKCTFLPKSLPPKVARAFILDLAGNRDSVDSVDMEIGGNILEVSDSQRKTVIVLRSNAVTKWKLNVKDEMRSHQFLFVREKKDSLNLAGSASKLNASETLANLDYSDTDLSSLISSTEALYNSKVVSFMKYDLPTDLVFLRVSAHVEESPPMSQSEYQLMVRDIHSQINYANCDRTKWLVEVPQAVLLKYGLSEDNLNFGDKACGVYKREDTMLYYDLTACDVVEDKGTYISHLEVTPKSASQEKEMFVPTDHNPVDTTGIPLKCRMKTLQDLKKKMKESIKQSCSKDVFVVRVQSYDPNYLRYINSTALRRCKSEYVSMEYIFQSNGTASCRMSYDNGLCKMEMPLNRTELALMYTEDPEESQSLLLSAKDPSAVKASYLLEVFYDYDMTKPLPFPAHVTMDDEALTTHRKTFHVKVSVLSNDPSLSVHLSECTVTGMSPRPHAIIINNCPADESVSFVQPYSFSASRSHQHFALNVGQLLGKGSAISVQCEVSSCMHPLAYDSKASWDEGPTVPQCWHLHGSECDEESVRIPYRLGDYFPEVLQTGKFVYAKQSDNIADINSGIYQKPKESQSGTITWPVALLLGLGAFLLGCLFLFILWRIDRNSYKQPQGRRTGSKRCESNSSSGSSGSQSTNSTKTTGSSSKSLLCFGKHDKDPKPRPSKEDAMALKPLITEEPALSHQGKISTTATSRPDGAMKHPPPALVHDDRHMYVCGGNGYVGIGKVKAVMAETDGVIGNQHQDPKRPQTVEHIDQQFTTALSASQERPCSTAAWRLPEEPPDEPFSDGNNDPLPAGTACSSQPMTVTSVSPQTKMDLSAVPPEQPCQAGWPADDLTVAAIKHRLEEMTEAAV